MLNSWRLVAGEWWSLLWSTLDVGGNRDAGVSVTHLIVRHGERTYGADVLGNFNSSVSSW